MSANPALIPSLVSLIVIVPLLIFWLWMFSAMLQNDDLPRDIKDQWTLWFVLLSIIAAGLYFTRVFRNRR